MTKLCINLTYLFAIFITVQVVAGGHAENDAEDAKKTDLKYCEKETHKHMHLSNFTKFRSILIDPSDSFRIEPNWVIFDRGSSVMQTTNSDVAVAINYHHFEGLDFDGTFFVDTDLDDDYFGLVFSFESTSAFYTIAWKKAVQTFWTAVPTRPVAEAGVQIKLVKSSSGPGPALRNALWNTGDTENEVKLLWKDPKALGWKNKTPYEWKLIHRPSIGLIYFTIYLSKEPIVEAMIFDSTLKGGRVGLFTFSQEMVVWSDMRYRCKESLPKEIHSKLDAALQAKITADD